MLLTLMPFALPVTAQFNLNVDATYLPGTEMKKVIVAFEDRSVWALSTQGRVYVKRQTDVGFTLYLPTQNDVVADVTGFSTAEMYFLVKPKKLIQIKNAVRIEIPVTAAGVTTINNIAVVQGKDNQNFERHYARQDWIAVATNLDLYSIMKGASVIREAIPYPNQPLAPERDWTITNSSFNGVDFRYKYPSGGRCADADYVSYNSVGTAIYQEIFPDKGAYPSKINCTLFDYRLNSILTNSSFGSYNFWGTDQGLYAKRSLDCSLIWMPLPGQVINDLEEVSALGTLYDLRFAMAATNNGLYFTRDPVHFSTNLEYENGVSAGDDFGFVQHSVIQEKVNAIANEITITKAPYKGGSYQFIMPCEKVVWLATDLGIRKLSVVLDQSSYTNTPVRALSFSKLPDNTDPDQPQFTLCLNESVQISAASLISSSPNVQLHWYKNGAEVAAWSGRKDITVNEAGTYRALIDLGCETATINSVTATVNLTAPPEISFNYPDPLKICEGSFVELNTVLKPGYVYQWFKDNQKIDGEIDSRFIADAAGTYRVEVKNCGSEYIASGNAVVNVASLPVPRIAASKQSYCVGDQAELRIDNPANYKIKWFLDKEEVVAFADRTTIIPTRAGRYMAALINTEGCTRSSQDYDLSYSAKPLATISSNATGIIYSGDQVKLSANEGSGFSYLWNTGAQSASIVVTTSGEYWVTVSNGSGCGTISNTIKLEFSPAPTGFALLNAFSPNGDGVNDYWKISGLADDAVSSLKIYNRLGQLVFVGNSNSVWDGKYRGIEVAAGVYYYLITSKSSVAPMKGHVTVIR
ncbi:MAG: gliding motility-associated C-terminal domain-containing protein [Bacteroidota bacterium]